MAGDGEYLHALHPNARKNDSKGNQDHSRSPPFHPIELDRDPQVVKSSSGSEALVGVKEVLDIVEICVLFSRKSRQSNAGTPMAVQQ